MQQTVQVPKTPAELSVLRARRDELTAQVQALTDRRVALMNERTNASAFTGNQSIVAELNAQVTEVSARMRRIESEKLAMDDAINSALLKGVAPITEPWVPPGVPAPAAPQVIEVPTFGPIEAEAMQHKFERMMMLEGLGFVLIGVVLWRWGLRRGRRPDVSHGDQQLRQAVDAIAIEVERISENQRYVTKLLAEQNQASPVSRPQGEAERVGRDAR